MSKSDKPNGQSRQQASDAAMNPDRRKFFMMGGSAVAAVAIVPLGSTDAVADEPQAERVKARYKETDHVKNYYRVNRY